MNPNRRRKGKLRAKRVLRACPYLDEMEAKRLLRTRKRCSCWMCGNPRKFFGEATLQEQKSDLWLSDGLEELSENGEF